VELFSGSGLIGVAGFGLAAGLLLLARGLVGYRTLIRVADTSTSTISSLAAGEVRVSGVIEGAELTLVSLLQRVPCVYYRSTIGHAGDGRGSDPDYTEERSIGFQVRDSTGTLRVFPRDARFDAPTRFQGETSLTGDEPAGLAADIAAARDSGALLDDATAAWGNAAIPGFGIGRPVVEPMIDPAANRLPLARPAEAAQAARTFEIAPGVLVLAASEEVPLLIAHGIPGAVVERDQDRFVVGLLGAVLAIGSAMVLAISLAGPSR
jgi:hypothetical protein